MKNIRNQSDSDFKDLTFQSLDFKLFISDLHLCATRPHITIAFLDFLKSTAIHAQSLYILGDLFEYWAGDDDVDNVHHQTIINALTELVDTGVSIYLMHGNRDFLIGSAFCKAAKVTLLQDPALIDVYGRKTLLSHGDDLCTDDIAYQNFRTQVRDVNWQADFLSYPLNVRKKQIEEIRLRSEKEKSDKAAEIMDVNQHAVEMLLTKYNYPELLIHGHTHRPYEHLVELNGHTMTRWVLGDWYEQGSYLICYQQGCRAVNL